ncbi:MAG: methyltransferase [Anaerolineales bacterium]|jgi:protein-S-isoprenylcysteine O-methyltransferase Ste14
MFAIYLYLSGLFIFVLGTGILGLDLRRHRSEESAEMYSRIMQSLFYVGLCLPPIVALFYPGLTHLDALVGLRPLSPRALFLAAGIILAMPGAYFFVAPNLLLRRIGSGAQAFRLTKRVVEIGVYSITRNPMSLGYYLLCLAVALVSGSTLASIAVIITLIPAHIFYLKYFEAAELKIRFGEEYMRYKQKTPFLIPRLPRG